jgi:transcription elongation factor Elf1
MQDLKVKIQCPNCQHSAQIKVKEMVPGYTKNCPSCGAQFNSKGDDGRKVQQALDDLNHTLKRLEK